MKTLLSTLFAVLVAGQALALGDGVFYRELNGDWVAYKTANFTHANSLAEKFLTFDSLPAYLFNSNGYRKVKIRVIGRLSTTDAQDVATKLDVNVNMGGTPHETVTITPTGKLTAQGFVVEADGTVRSSGSSGTISWALRVFGADPTSTHFKGATVTANTDTLNTNVAQMPSISLDYYAALGEQSVTVFQAECRVSR